MAPFPYGTHLGAIRGLEVKEGRSISLFKEGALGGDAKQFLLLMFKQREIWSIDSR